MLRPALSWILLCALLASPAHAAEAVADAAPAPARALLERAFANRYDVDLTSVIELIVRSRTGQEIRKTLHAMSKRIDDRMHSIGRLVAPESVRGMTVLMVEAEDRSHDAFVYLPSLALVRRISTAQRGDSFFGTDVTYDDLERQRAQDFDLEGASSGELAGEAVHWVSARPRRAWRYERVRFALAASDLSILVTEYYKRGAEQPCRVIRAERASMVAEHGHVLPTHLFVESRDRGTSTEVRIENLRIDPPIDARLFSLKTLESRRALPVTER